MSPPSVHEISSTCHFRQQGALASGLPVPRSSASDSLTLLLLLEGARWRWQLAAGNWCPCENSSLRFLPQPMPLSHSRPSAAPGLPLPLDAQRRAASTSFSLLIAQLRPLGRRLTDSSRAFRLPARHSLLDSRRPHPGIWHHCRGCPALPEPSPPLVLAVSSTNAHHFLAVSRTPPTKHPGRLSD